MMSIEGWSTKTLLDLLSLIIDFRGRTPKKLGMEWGGGDIPALSANNVEMGRINFSKECYLGSDSLYRRWMTRGDAQMGDVVLTTEAPLGNIAQIPDGRRYILSQRTILLRANDAELCNDYLRHYLASENFQNLMRQQSSGTTATGIQRAKLEELPLRFPDSKLEQAKIAAILSTIDLAIEQTEAIIAKQQRIKTGLMQDLLTKGIDENGNVRSEATHAFKDSPLGQIPTEWEARTIGWILNEYGGKLQTGPFGSQLHASEYVAEGIPFVMPQDIQDSGISEVNIARITEERANDLARHRMLPGDIVFARRGDLSRCAVVNEYQKGWVCGSGCFLMKPPKKAISSRWITEVYRYHTTQLQVGVQAVGSTMVNFNTGILASLYIPLPTHREQVQIEEHLNEMEEEQTKLWQQLSKLKRTKSGLMQDLLTGNVRVTTLLKEAVGA